MWEAGEYACQVPAERSVAGCGMSRIVDVARHAGVSVSTVSHVVNGTRFVSPETAQRVNEAIEVFGYLPNGLARALKRASTSSVGLAISAISNPYFSDIICAIEAECARLGLTVLLSDTQEDPERELAVVKTLHQRRVDGIVLAPSADPELSLAYLERVRLPCVLVDRMADGRFDQVGVDNAAAMRVLVDHVIAKGHYDIGYICGQPGLATTTERVDGFRAALAANGIALPADWLSSSNATSADATASARAMLMLAQRPSVLVTGNNMATIGTMRAIRELSLHVPGDVAVVGIDDFEWADCFEPRLTLMAQPCEEIGRQAASLLVQRIESPEGQRRAIRLEPTLQVRESCRRQQ